MNPEILGTFTAPDYYDELAQLRRESPVHQYAPNSWMVTRYDDGRVTVTVTDPERPRAVVAAERLENGRLVTLSDGSIATTPFFERTFLPGETNEVRVYADSGDDAAVVRGVPSGTIAVRIIGGKGDDVFADSAGGGATFFYDAEGNNRFETASGTHVDQRAWKPLTPGFGFKLDDPWRPDWGKKRGWRPVVDYNTGRSPGPNHETRALFQLKFYALVVLRTRGIVPARLRLIYLADGQLLDYSPEHAELLRFEKTLIAIWQAIQNAGATGDFRPQPSRLCDWCSHRALCPAFGGTPPPYPGWPADSAA